MRETRKGGCACAAKISGRDLAPDSTERFKVQGEDDGKVMGDDAMDEPEDRRRSSDVDFEQFFPGESADLAEAGPSGSGNADSATTEAIAIQGTSGQPDGEDAQEEEEPPVYDDPTGSLFAGPTAATIPSSVSAMRVRSRSRSFVRYDRVGRRLSISSEPDDVGSIRSGKSGGSRRSRRRATRRDSEESNGDGRSTGRRRKKSKSEESDGESVGRLTFSKRRPSKGRRRRDDASEEEESEEENWGFFGNLSAILKGKRPAYERAADSDSSLVRPPSSRRSRRRTASIGRYRSRSSASFGLASERDSEEGSRSDEEADPYGPYGSSSASTSTTNSDPSTSSGSDGSRRRRGGRDGLLGSGISVGAESILNGESRIEMGSPPLSPFDREDDPFWTGEPSGLGRGESATSSRQPIYISDEDLQLKFIGWGEKTWKRILWAAGCVGSAGTLWLLGRWQPAWWLAGRGVEREFLRASHVVIESQYGDFTVLPVQTLNFAKPLPMGAVFPPSSRTPPMHRDDPLPPKPVLPAWMASLNGAHSNHASRVGSSANSIRSKHIGPLLDSVQYVEYRYYRFLLHQDTGRFRMARDWQDPEWWMGTKALKKGVTQDEGVTRRQMFGENVIEIAGKTIPQLLFDEVLHPFYVFQIASIILWSIDDYYYYAFCIALISIVSVVTTLVETRRNIDRMREMSRYTCQVDVHRQGEWSRIDSGELVPGDIVDVSDSTLSSFPADFLLLSGDAIVNESMLTGESVPVSKIPIDDAAARGMGLIGGDLPPQIAKHVLFCGTRIVRIRKTGATATAEATAQAIVIRTGFNTTKGALVRSMLFPKPLGFAFYRDSFRFIGVLAIIAGLGFLASAFNFVKLGIKWHTILIRALDLITIVVPPALPATMSIGTSFAIGRLRKLGIFCISPNRVNIGGKVNLFCFDKTGTLTEDGLDVLGVRSVNRTDKVFSDLYEDIESVPILGAADQKTPLMHALATCHGLKVVDGEAIGDPLDLRMFEFTKWSIEEGGQGMSRPSAEVRRSKEQKRHVSKKHHHHHHHNDKVAERPAALVQTVVRPPGGMQFEVEDAMKAARFLELGVIRTFDFVSSLRRMSVLVKKLKSSTVEAYVKGAPEVMVDICDKESLPDDYDMLLDHYTKHGFRVIALAAKSMPDLTWIKAQRLKREQVESGLRFLGLIIFENKLKPGTTPAMHTLRSAHIGTRMCTGDNIRTAISVGRECGMVSESAKVYMPMFLKGSQTVPDSAISWFDVEDESSRLDSYTLQPLTTDDDLSNSTYGNEGPEYVLAVSGDVFRWMIDYGARETMHRMLYKGVIFARMSPDEKHELVDRLQTLDYTVGFCGDGANDCGALKAADVGISLSEAEASVAAPFTSRQLDISCVIEVIKEGRAALVTSFSCFKYMALYSLIQFTTVTLLYAIASSLGDFQFLYIDLFIILPVAVAMGRTLPYPRIVPKRPTANLVSKKVLVSLFGQIIITSGLQFLVFWRIRSQPWYVAPIIDVDELETKNYENTALFLVSSFQYVFVAATFSVGPPYRKPMFSNPLLVLCLAVLGAFSTYVLFVTSGPVFSILELMELPREFHLELMLLVISNIVISVAFETHGAARVARWWGQQLKKLRKLRGGSGQAGKQKLYKALASAMDR